MANLPKTGITISAVGEKLGTTSRDLKTLCKHENINMWSMNKPIAYLTTDPLTDDQRKEKRYGLTTCSANTAVNMVLLVNASDGIGIEYDKPAGNFREPCRLGDFRNYKHDAQNPVTPWFKNAMSANTSNSWDSITGYYLSNLDGDGQLTIKDVYPYIIDEYGEPITDLNYGFAIILTATTAITASAVKWSVGGIPWDSSTWSNFKGKWCYVYEFLTNLPSGTTSADYLATVSDYFLPIAECRHRVFFKTTSSGGGGTGEEFTLGARFETSRNTVTGTITLSSVDTTTATYTGGTVTMMKAELLTSSTATSNVGKTDVVTTGSQYTLGAEATKTFNLIIQPTTTVVLSSCKVKLSWQTKTNQTVQTRIFSIMQGVDILEPIE